MAPQHETKNGKFLCSRLANAIWEVDPRISDPEISVWTHQDPLRTWERSFSIYRFSLHELSNTRV